MRDKGLEKRMERASRATEARVLRDLGFFGHFLHVHAGGRGGKQYILSRLLRSGGAMTQRELQEHAHVTAAALSEVLAKLETEGLVLRTRSARDRRQLDIALTEGGTRRAEQIVRQKLAFQEASLSPLTVDEREQLADMLDKVADHWRTYGDGTKEGTCKN